MKKLFFGCLLAALASTSLMAQFSDTGYGDFKLGTSFDVLEEKLQPYITERSEYGIYATLKMNNTKIKLTFIEGLQEEGFALGNVSSIDKNARLVGLANEELIGKSLKDIKKILGNKLGVFTEGEEGEEEGNTYFYILDKNNEQTSCVLHFNEENILEEIYTTYNP